MKQNKFTFKDTNITVDWIGFKFQNIEILAKSNKDNQNKVIGILQKMGY